MGWKYGKFLGFSIFSLLGLAACATNARQIIGPDGTPHELVYCNTIEYCYTGATQVCGGKYKIVNTTSELTGFHRSTLNQIDMLVKCESDSQASPQKK
jgi:hypothetical protein